MLGRNPFRKGQRGQAGLQAELLQRLLAGPGCWLNKRDEAPARGSPQGLEEAQPYLTSSLALRLLFLSDISIACLGRAQGQSSPSHHLSWEHSECAQKSFSGLNLPNPPPQSWACSRGCGHTSPHLKGHLCFCNFARWKTPVLIFMRNDLISLLPAVCLLNIFNVIWDYVYFLTASVRGA